MKILSVNAGSSSLKFTAYEMPEEKVLMSGYIEKIGLEDSFYTLKLNGEKIKKDVLIKDHQEATEKVIEELLAYNIISDLSEIKAVGHRVVHGGDKYAASVVIDDDVIKTVEDISSLAPLHNPANLVGIRACMESFKDAVHVAIFDTAFHQTMPEVNYLYPVPYSWYEDYKIRKYGFHGTSHRYITEYVKKMLNKEDINIISCHIGSGGSITAIKDGKSYDTTMGFSPNAGIMMGTRCGDIDYSLAFYAMDKGLSQKEVDNALNKKSGLLGITGDYSDHRDIEDAMARGEEKAFLANDMYVNRIAKYIADYYVELEGKVDAIIFTAGLGENAIAFRKDVIDRLNCLGLEVDEEANDGIARYRDKQEGLISSAKSVCPIYVIPTDEEVMIARDAYEAVK